MKRNRAISALDRLAACLRGPGEPCHKQSTARPNAPTAGSAADCRWSRFRWSSPSPLSVFRWRARRRRAGRGPGRPVPAPADGEAQPVVNTGTLYGWSAAGSHPMRRKAGVARSWRGCVRRFWPPSRPSRRRKC